MKNVILASEKTGCFATIVGIASEKARGSRMLYIPTAAFGEGWEPSYDEDVLPFERAGFTVEMFDLTGKSRAETVAALDRCDIVFVGGGNTFHLLHHMRESGFFDEIRERVENGLVYAGSSAGAVVATQDIGYAASVDDPSKGGHHGNRGLGFVDHPILPHMDHPAFGHRVVEIAYAFGASGTTYYGLDDNEAVVIDENGPRIVKCHGTPTTSNAIEP